MIVNVRGKERELKFTFNSFRYMEDFDIGELSELERKPFKIIKITESLLIGAFNHNPKDVVKQDEINEYLQDVMENGDVSELLETLMQLLEDSNFFKNLQKK